MKLARELLICCLLICACAFLFQGALFLQASAKAAEATRKAAEGADLLRLSLQAQVAGNGGILENFQKRMTGTFQNINALLIQAGLTADEVRRTSLDERVKLASLSDASIQSVKELGGAARNGAAAAQSLQGAAAELGGTAAALRVDAEAAKPTIEGATTLLSTLNAGSGQVLDRVTATVGDLDARVKAVAPIEANLESVTGHVDQGSKSLAETLGFIEDNFRPRKVAFWQRMLDVATGGFFSVALHWIPQRVREVH